MKFEIGQMIKMKKQHPCKSYEWKVLDIGINIKIQCMKCGREVLIFKPDLEKKIRNT